mmetsp:Transcript_6808/g.22014  ORF Transcript_6808/g.22014 Transcript_6808/m.22014 type:complete len:343 (+) Transcript_6808:600-1628(+)
MPTRSAGGSFRGLRLGTAAVVEEARCTAYLFESAVVRSRLVKNAPIKSRSAPRSMGRSSGYGAKTPTSLVLKARAGSRSAPPKSPKDFMRSAYWWPSKYAKATRCENDPSKRHASNSLTTSSLKSPPLLPPTKDAFDRSWLRRSRKRSSIGSRRASYRAKLEAVSSPTSGSEDRSTQSASPPSNSSNVVLATAPSSSRRKAADGVRSTQSASAKAALSSLLRTAPKYAVRRGRSLVATSWNSTHSSSSTPAPSEKKPTTAEDPRGRAAGVASASSSSTPRSTRSAARALRTRVSSLGRPKKSATSWTDRSSATGGAWSFSAYDTSASAVCGPSKTFAAAPRR